MNKLLSKLVKLLNLGVAHYQQQQKTQAEDLAYIALNNLYLDIEAGRKHLTVTRANTLRVLAVKAYKAGDSMVTWWESEFRKLPRWYYV